jgi:hypothetical protein
VVPDTESVSRRRALAVAIATLVLLCAAPAHAGGGDYAFVGGTGAQRQQVRRALEASAFPWSIVPARIVIHLAPGQGSEATPGHVYLDSNLFDGTTFGWGVAQHEYAHEVDFFLFDDATRTLLNTALGGRTWYQLGLHGDAGVERFASTLAWAYWPSPANSMRPTSPTDEAAALPPAAFRALVEPILAARAAATPRS